uniref:Uncharacterized protein n=1 Tax=Meloidogyne enterolobii TaxID=390850 RepID=A0A6V7X6K9_MELEN|nr:unnamed protein product [Meloidogyne enterolobii]
MYFLPVLGFYKSINPIIFQNSTKFLFIYKALLLPNFNKKWRSRLNSTEILQCRKVMGLCW